MTIEMVAISPMLFDTAEPLIVERPGRGSRIDRGDRRVSRTATLEPGVFVHDGGYVDGDRTVRVIVSAATEAEIEAARRLIKLHNEVRVSMIDGSFLGAPESWDYQNGDLILTILLKSKLSA